MIKTLSVDANNDLFVNTSGSISVSTNQDALVFMCEHVAKTILGELVLQGDVGIPYFQTMWNGTPNLAQAENALRAAWLNVDGVLGIVSLASFVQDNTLFYNATIKTVYGEVSLGV